MRIPAPTDPAARSGPPERPAACANCGAALTGRYCAACGQKDQPLRQPIHRVAVEAATEVLGIDGRLWRTLARLMRPGRLTRAYLDGHRTRFVRPLRLYVLSTLLFFFLINVLDPVGSGDTLELDVRSDTTATAAARLAEIDAVLVERAERTEAQQALVDSLRGLLDLEGAEASGADAPTNDSLVAEARESDRLEGAKDDLADLRRAGATRRARQLAWQRDYLATLPPDSLIRPEDYAAAAGYLFPQSDVTVDLPAWASGGTALNRLKASRTDAERRAAIADLLRSTIRQVPTVMFLLLPVFALLLKVVYLRRDWYYGEHLVFALHVHAFAFLVFTVVALAFQTPLGGLLVIPCLLAIPIYVYLAQKHVYGQGWLKTAVKGTGLGMLYLFALSGGMVLAVLLAAAFG